MDKDEIVDMSRGKEHIGKNHRHMEELLAIVRRVAKLEFRLKKLRETKVPSAMAHLQECSLREAEGELQRFLASRGDLANSASALRLFCSVAEANNAAIEMRYDDSPVGRAIGDLVSALEETRVQLVRDNGVRKAVGGFIRKGYFDGAEDVLHGLLPNYELLLFLVGEIKDRILDLLKELARVSGELDEERKKTRKRRKKG